MVVGQVVPNFQRLDPAWLWLGPLLLAQGPILWEKWASGLWGLLPGPPEVVGQYYSSSPVFAFPLSYVDIILFFLLMFFLSTLFPLLFDHSNKLDSHTEWSIPSITLILKTLIYKGQINFFQIRNSIFFRPIFFVFLSLWGLFWLQLKLPTVFFSSFCYFCLH